MISAKPVKHTAFRTPPSPTTAWCSPPAYPGAKADDKKWYPGKAMIGSYIRTQRELSRQSLRELARMSQVSNAYLSQVERGIHEPSLRVLAAVAEALSLPLEDLTAQARPDAEPAKPGRDIDAVTAAIRAEPRRSQSQKEALLAVYSSYLVEGDTQRNSVD